MFLLNGKPLAVDTPFTANDIQYPANWLRLSTEAEKIAIGITEVPDPVRADDRFYWGGDINNPKDIDKVKEMLISQVKAIAGSLLNPTDWKVIRATEGGKALDDTTKAERIAIRTKSDDFETQIKTCTTVEQLAALQFNWEQING